MKCIRLFGKAPETTLKELGITPEIKEGTGTELDFVTEVFHTRTAAGAAALDKFFKFKPAKADTCELDLQAIDCTSYEICVVLSDILDLAGNPDDLDKFAELAQFPSVKASIIK